MEDFFLLSFLYVSYFELSSRLLIPPPCPCPGSLHGLARGSQVPPPAPPGPAAAAASAASPSPGLPRICSIRQLGSLGRGRGGGVYGGVDPLIKVMCN